MTVSLVFLLRLLTLVLSQAHCLRLNDAHSFTTADSSNIHQTDSSGAIRKLPLTGETSKSITTSSLKSPPKISPSKRRATRDVLKFRLATPNSSSSLLQSKVTSRPGSWVPRIWSRLVHRGLSLDLSDAISNPFGLFGDSSGDVNKLNLRSSSSAMSPPMGYPSQNGLTAPTGPQIFDNNYPTASAPRPTQAPIPLNASTDPAAPKPSTSSAKPQSGTVRSNLPSVTSAAILSKTSSTAALPTATQAPLSAFQKFKSYYDPKNPLNALAVLLTLGFVMGFLVSLVAAIKCVCHRKRFANKKDYPDGFPWVETNKTTRTNSQRQGLISTASFISTRNSIASTIQLSDTHHQNFENDNAINVEYQLNELGSDIYGYSWVLKGLDVENNACSPSEEAPSSAFTDPSSQSQSIESRQDDDEWDARSLNEGPCFVRGGQRVVLHESKVIKIGAI